MRLLAACLLAAAANAVDGQGAVDTVSMNGEAVAAVAPPRLNPRHHNPPDWAQQADASAAALPESQGKGGLSLGGGYEEVVGDNVSLVRAHARSTAAAAEQADEQSGQVGKSMKSAKL